MATSAYQAETKNETVVHNAEDRPDRISDERQQRLKSLHEQYGATWEGINDQNDPYNWTTSRKIVTAIIVSVGQLITLMSTSMIAAPLSNIAEDLDMDPEEAQVAFSIFILGFAFAPLVIAALSEMYGRKPVWIFSNMWYVFWNAICPVGHSSVLMIVGRFMAGSGASCGITLTAPVLTDLYHKERRGRSLAMATFIPYLGPALGPILGGVIAQQIRWEWLFYILSMFTALNTVIGIFFFNECYTPTLLRAKAKKLNPSMSSSVTAVGERLSSGFIDFLGRLRLNLSRPLALLIQRPVMQFASFIFALNFGTYILVLSTYANVWIQRYHQSESVSSLHYIAIAVGATLASQGGGPLMDLIFRRMRDSRNDGHTTPEFRAPFLIPAVLFYPIGLLLSGWSAQNTIHWAAVDLGTAIFVTGGFLLAQGLMAYIFDEFEHAASANAASRVLSNILGFAFPIFAPAMYNALGYGWGNTLLAFVSVALVTPTPFILWVFGPKLRAIGRKE